MERLVAVSILAVYVAVSCALAFRLRSQVNVRLPRGQSAKIMPAWNYWRTLKLHRKFYPVSRLRLAVYLLDFAGPLAFFLVLAVIACWHSLC